MKTIISIGILAVLIFSGGKEPIVENTNPRLPEKHIADETGYLHEFPCHGGEIAAYLGRDGCYELDWNKTSEAAKIKSGECKIDSQNVLVCKGEELK